MNPGEIPIHDEPRGTSRGRTIGLIAAAVVVVAVVMVALGWTGHLYLWTTEVRLPPPNAQVQPGLAYYTSQFDGGVVNEFSESQAAQGTAQATVLFSTPEAGRGTLLEFQLWHAEETRVRNVRLRIETPREWGELFVKLDQGADWGPLLHTTAADGVVVDLEQLGRRTDGYRGTVFLSFRPEWPEAVATWGGTVRVEAEFDMHGTGLRRFLHWRVRGNWELPVKATAAGEERDDEKAESR